MAQILQFIRPDTAFDAEATSALAAAYDKAAARLQGQPAVLQESLQKEL